MTEDAEYRDFVRSTGFEYSRDLTHAVLALLPVTDSTDPHEGTYQTVVLTEGRFDRDKVTRYALRDGSIESVAGLSIIRARNSKSENSTRLQANPLLLAFLSGERLAIVDVPGGESSQLQRAREAILAAAEGGRGSRVDMQANWAGRVAGAPFFVIGREGAVRRLRARLESMSANSRQVANVMADLRGLAIAARPEQDQVRVSMVGECDSVLKATQLELLLHGLSLLSRGALDGPKSRGQLSPEEAELLDRVLATARIRREQNSVEVRLEVPIQLLLGNPVKR